MLFANEENVSQTFLQICRGTVLSGNVLILGRIAHQTDISVDAHLLRKSRYMFVTIFKLTTFMILNTSCEKKNA